MTDDELKRLLEGQMAETRRHFDVTTDDFKALHEETRRHFDVTTESIRAEIRLVAEIGADTRQMLIREAADIREELRRTAAETQAMIKFSTWSSIGA